MKNRMRDAQASPRTTRTGGRCWQPHYFEVRAGGVVAAPVVPAASVLVGGGTAGGFSLGAEGSSSVGAVSGVSTPT